jgi:Ca2+-binding RTX toxin-like protein
MRLLSVLGSLLLVVSGLLAVQLLAPSAAHADGYPQTGWHATSVFNDGSTRSTTVIDCQSVIISNMGGGTSYDSSGWTYTPPMPVTPSTGVTGAMGAEVNLDSGHPRVGETFYLHVWMRSISTPCGFQGIVPVFVLPSGVSIDTTAKTLCFFDGVAENDATCPQPGTAKFQSATATTGKANSWQILCGYATGCYDTHYWPTVGSHGVEIAVPVTSATTFNGSITGGAVINTEDVPTYYAMQAPLNVFAANTGTGVTPPASTTNPAVSDPGYAYRIRYDDPSTITSASYVLNPSQATAHGLLSRAEVFTNHVPGQVVFVRDTVRSRIASAPATVAGFNNGYATQVAQWAMGSIDNAGDSFQSEFDWRPTGNGSNPSMGVANGTTYYWRYGYVPYPGGSTPSGEIVWGDVESFAAPPSGLTCNGIPATVAIGLGELPTPGDDVIVGTAGDDAINGLGGNDTICGGGGRDTINGGAGNDKIYGEAGDDVLIGGDGNDTLRGGDGNDILLPGLGADTAFGEAGFDTVSYSDITVPYSSSTAAYTGVWVCSSTCASGFTNVAGAAGLDEIGADNATQGHIAWPERIIGTPFDDVVDGLETGTVVIGGDGDDRLSGGPGADTFQPGRGHDTVTGGPGDAVSYLDVAGGVTASLVAGTPGSDTITGVSALSGGPGRDVLIGTPGADRISGGGGDDLLRGGGGNDTLRGGAGNDRLDGGPGNDRLLAGIGNDTLFGGAGADTLDGGPGDDRLSGDADADVLIGGTGNDRILAGPGNDRILAGPGNDAAWGGPGNDRVYGGPGDDRVYGEAGNDLLYGEAGKDTLSGGAGRDLLVGAAGKDLCLGGAGHDRARSCERRRQIP